MTLEEFYTYKEQAFDAFCKAVIRNESTDQLRVLARRAAREINLSELSNNDLVRLQQTDQYHPESITLWVRGHQIQVEDLMLGRALQSLTPHKREVILLSYFLEHSDIQIGKLLHMNPRTVCYRRSAALERLKLLLEASQYEND